MPIRVQIGVCDCGHWTAPFQDTFNFATLVSQAADCGSCAVIAQWILTTYASRCESEADDMAAMSESRKVRKRFRWKASLRRLGLGCVRGVWFTLKFVGDVGLVLLACGLIAIGVASIPILVGIWVGALVCSLVLAGLCLYVCREPAPAIIGAPLGAIWMGFSLALGAIKNGYRLAGDSASWIFGTNLGHDEGLVAPPMWTELVDYSGQEGYRPAGRLGAISDIESGISGNGMELAMTLRKESVPLVADSWVERTDGVSCIGISSTLTSPERPGIGCNIYQHTYNPRGPVGSLVYFVRGIRQRENHPTHFLSLAAGKLFLAAWPPEQERWSANRTRMRISLTKLQGQEYNQIQSFTPSSGNTTKGAPLPTRLLDLGECEDSDIENLTVSAIRKNLSTSTVKLITTSPSTRGRYLALSHRWGDDEDFTLKSSSPLSSSLQRGDGIPFSTIPKTFQDALVVTRLLHHRYLWIDALCIIQDDPADWARESGRMAAVYSNASCTISAHTARNSRAGFLDASLEPPPTLVLRSASYFLNPFRTITHLTLLGSFADQVAASFLSRRGWVFQERVLSRRLLHFVRHHTFFEDAAGAVADDVVNAPVQRLEEGKWSVTDSFHGSVYWYRLVERYSKCALTYEKDRLPAIAGLAQSFGDMNDPGRYMFGLWERAVHLGLLWVNGSGRPVGRDLGDVTADGFDIRDRDGSDRLTLTSQVTHNDASDAGVEDGAASDKGQSNTKATDNGSDNEADMVRIDLRNGSKDVEVTATLPSWSWACCRGAVIYPNTLSDSMKSDLSVVRNEDPKILDASQGMAEPRPTIDKTQLLVVDGLLVELGLVHAKVNPTPQGMPFFDPAIQRLYSMTSAGNQFGSWVSLDNQMAASEVVVFPRLSCLRVCSLQNAENTFVLRYETTFYFLLLVEVGGTENGRCYRRVGVGATGQDYWAGVERSRVRIE